MDVILWLKDLFFSNIYTLKYILWNHWILSWWCKEVEWYTFFLIVQPYWDNQNVNWRRKLSGFVEPLASVSHFSESRVDAQPTHLQPQNGSNSDHNTKRKYFGFTGLWKSSVPGHLLQQSQPHKQLDRLRQHLPHWDAHATELPGWSVVWWGPSCSLPCPSRSLVLNVQKKFSCVALTCNGPLCEALV